MKQNLSNITFSSYLTNILKSNKIEDVCICPGSRNTPLSISFINESFFNCKSHIDERAAGFFSLGIAKSINKPSIIITTSGTAVANLLPATIEADLSTTPLIIISADRPKHLHNTGENQTINQNNILDNFVRESMHIELSSINPKIIFQDIQNIIEKCKGIKGVSPPGPIHINIAFDEPLVDELIDNKIKVNKSKYEIQSTQFNIPNCNRPIIVCGKIEDEFTINQIISLSEKMNAPILADPCSSLRYNTKHPNILSFYNFFIDKIKPLPDLVIRFGKKPVSKKLNDFLKKIKNKTILLTKYNGYNDDAKSIYISDFKSIKINNKSNDNWINKIQNLEKSISNKIQPYLNKKYFYEGNIIYHCLEQFENNNNLFIGNSLPIRNLENFCPNINKKINVYSNRGASGIDGLIATAIGTTCHNQESKTTLIIGDISFFYDSNSLLIANKYQLNINIIILNNNGGQIFNKLPYAKNNIKDFEDFWITPIDLEIKQISKLYNANYFSLDSIESIQKKLTKIMSKSGINIIEIPCDPKTTFNLDKIIEQKF